MNDNRLREFSGFDEDSKIISYYDRHPAKSPALTAYIAGLLSKREIKNGDIRKSLRLPSVDITSHFIRVGKTFSHLHLTLCHRNPDRVMLGHMRALTSVTDYQRDNLLRTLISRKLSVAKLTRIVKGKEDVHTDSNIIKLEEMVSNIVGFDTKIDWDSASARGKISFTFHSLDGLDNILERLNSTGKGYMKHEQY